LREANSRQVAQHEFEQLIATGVLRAQGFQSVRNPSSNFLKTMDTHIWKKLWAFLTQPAPEDSAEVNSDSQLLERCWNRFSVLNAKPDLQLLERCWNMPCVQSKYDC
jgi:hypothetical protein